MTGPRHARLMIPSVATHTIERAGLVPLVDQPPVVVLAGMAGYGKSTLLVATVRRQQDTGAAVWLGLDDCDRAPVRLVSDLITAARLSGLGEDGTELEALTGSALRAEPVALVDAFLEVVDGAAAPVTLVLDDLQELTGATESTQLIDHILRWAPANMRIALAARGLPPLRLQRLRLDGRLTFLSHEQLAFTPQETAQAVRAAGLALDPDTVESVHRTTGGWPAGVRMAILAARQYGLHKQVPAHLRRDQALTEYLATEVLASLPDELRSFVLDATLDENVCASLVDSIRGTRNADALLERCVADGLFLTRGRGNTEEVWYAWHPLFAAHVQRRLVAGYPERTAARHAAAARWWTSVDAPTAIRHAVAAGDEGCASKIFADHWLELVLEGRTDAVLHAVEQLSERSPYSGDAHLARALILLQDGALDDARAQIQAATDAMALLPPQAKAEFEDRLALVELFHTGYGFGFSAAVTPGAALLERFHHDGDRPHPAMLASVQMFVGRGGARHPESDRDAILEMLRSSAVTAHDTGLLALELTALAESLIPAIAPGRLGELGDIAVSVLTRADDRGWVGLATLAPAVGFLGFLDYWRGNLTEARAQLERSLSMMLPYDWDLRVLVLKYLTHVSLALGDVAAARTTVDELQTVIESGRSAPVWRSMLAALQGLVLVAEGKTGEAAALAAVPITEPGHPMAALYRAEALLRAGLPAQALDELPRLPFASRFIHFECLARCLQAEAHAQLGRADAHAALELALAAAEPDGLYGPLLATGERLPELLQSHLSHGTAHPAAVAHVLARIAEGRPQHGDRRGIRLTDRERVILRYLTTNLTAAEIAEAEYISLNTTKTHIAHIYQKLGVGSRRAAVRRASELGLS